VAIPADDAQEASVAARGRASTTNFKQPGFIVYYVWAGSVTVSILLWCLFK
jgi:hypothetical protein